MRAKTVLQNRVVSKIKDIYEIRKDEFANNSISNPQPKQDNEGFDDVSRPKHYCNTAYQPIYVIEDWAKALPPDEVFSFGNAIKYIKRYREKGTPVKDIDKAIWYLVHLKLMLEEKGEK